jgi:hypothetical protein
MILESRQPSAQGRADREGGSAKAEVYVMVHAPAPGYAGHVGDEVILTDQTPLSVYVRFASGIVECYPPLQFATLFRPRGR